MKLFRIWYTTEDNESDFTECMAENEEAARFWFRAYHCNYIESIEVAEYALL